MSISIPDVFGVFSALILKARINTNNKRWNENVPIIPYFLTANHCGMSSTVNDYNKWVFYFNFECPDCICQTVPGSRTISGSTKIAAGTDDPSTGSDFKLLRLNTKVPKDYQPYYSGWSGENSGSSNGVGIHHPKGDVKKISTYTSALTSSNWSGSGSDPGEKYWRVVWSATASGHGVTEKGSSGSPIFDHNKSINCPCSIYWVSANSNCN